MASARRTFIIDGSKVRERRERLGLSQPELARRCGITQPHMSRIEGGVRNPRAPLLVTIASVLGVPVDDIADLAEAVA